MSNKDELKKQVKEVIKYLEEKYKINEEKGVLELIHKRYINALNLLECNEANKDNLYILGGVRAYLDSYSDYDNPLLSEMGKAEELVQELFY
ncbi:hypothetical protein [Pelosinus fermentans]|uniref:Uncharacterized protein n=1 Tax=Pelosinus fermentans JBW45 TaxID=1192197 RepID=I8TTC8_9FIRM|nr:hypothetical protein [Pelosinus fermentans]AJQ29641.1 hypothetical protein JBW_04310 [Pelosinus fermentans JBW45]